MVSDVDQLIYELDSVNQNVLYQSEGLKAKDNPIYSINNTNISEIKKI